MLAHEEVQIVLGRKGLLTAQGIPSESGLKIKSGLIIEISQVRYKYPRLTETLNLCNVLWRTCKLMVKMFSPVSLFISLKTPAA